MKELLKECRAAFKWMEYEPWRNKYDQKCGEMVAKLDAALAAEEKREPDAWKPIEIAPKSPDWVLLGYFQDYMPGKYQGGHPVIAYWSGDTWVDCCGRSLRKEGIFSPTHWMPIPKPSIAPPQVKSEPEKVAEEDAPQPGQPADGAARCPRCCTAKPSLVWKEPFDDANPHATELCTAPWHDSESDIDFLNIAKLQRDSWKADAQNYAEVFARGLQRQQIKYEAALRELNELKSKIAQIATAQYYTQHDK